MKIKKVIARTKSLVSNHSYMGMGGTYSDSVPASAAEKSGPCTDGHMARRRDMLKLTAGLSVLGFVPAVASRSASAEVNAEGKDAVGCEQDSLHDDSRLTAEELGTLAVLADWIIPADDRGPSAVEAGVVDFLNAWISHNPDRLLPVMRGGLMWLDVQSIRRFSGKFTDSSEDQQKQMLDLIAWPESCAPENQVGESFFSQLRDLVIGAYFSTEAGVRDLPFLGNRPMTEWTGCPPEVLTQLGVGGQH